VKGHLGEIWSVGESEDGVHVGPGVGDELFELGEARGVVISDELEEQEEVEGEGEEWETQRMDKRKIQETSQYDFASRKK